MEPLSIDKEEWSSFFRELKGETGRAAAILVAAYIDSLLRAKLETLFCKGNSEIRQKLFESQGAFGTFSAKVDAAYCLGWLEPSVFHDIGIIRKIRNEFAHRIHGLTFEDCKIKRLVRKLEVPDQLFYDWGSLKWGALQDEAGIVLFSGEPDENIKNVSDLPAEFIFRMAASWVLGVLAKNLQLRFHGADGSPLSFRLVTELEDE
jgi:hypothetical protein